MKSVSILLSIYCFFLSNILKANSKIDSLESVYQSVAHDTMRINAAHELFALTFRKDLSKAEAYNTFIQTKAKKLAYPKGLVNGFYGAGIIAYLKGEFPTAINNFEKAISYCEAAQMDPIRFKVSMAGVYQVTGKLDKAILIYEQAIAHFDSTKNLANGILAANNLGVVYSNQGNYKRALKIYEQAFEYTVELKDSLKMASFLINIGNSFFDIGNKAKAIEKLSVALAISEATGDKRGQSIALNTIGEQYLEAKQAEKSLIYFERSRLLKEGLGYKPSVANTLMFEGQAYAELGELATAKEKITKAIAIQKEVQDVRPLAGSYFIYGEILMNNERINDGVEQFKQAEVIATQTNNKGLLSDIYLKYAELINTGKLLVIDESEINVLAALNKAETFLLETDDQKNIPKVFQAKSNWFVNEGDYKNAFKYSEALQNIKDSLYTKEQAIALQEMRTKFETNQKEKENELLIAKNELINKQNKLYLAGLITILLFTILLGYLYWSLKKTKDELAVQKQMIEEQNIELSALNQTKDRFFSIIAHDLRSPIAAFQGIGAQINYFLKKEAYDRLTQLGSSITHSSIQLNNLLDNLLNWSLSQMGKIPYRPKTIPLNEIAEDTITLFEGVSQSKNISIVPAIASNLSIFADERAVSTIFRNLINNAIKFSEIGTTIQIEAANLTDDFVKIAFKDEGVGMNNAQLAQLFDVDKQSQQGTAGEQGTGLGLILCKDLLSVNQGRIEVESEVGIGTTFSVFLPKSK